MSAPRLLLVDDSEAILAYEAAVLGGHYTTTPAIHGREGLRLAREIAPSAVLLDLSMPEMDGLDVLAAMKADPALASIPVIVVSTEHDRADECIRAGAAEFVEKPIRADVLRSVVARVLSDAQREAARGSLAVLHVEVGGLSAALSLDAVFAVAAQPATFELETSCDFLSEGFDFRGELVAVLDLARRFSREHAARVVDRKLVIGGHLPRGSADDDVVTVRSASPSEPSARACRLAVCVDEVHDPEIVSRAAVLDKSAASGRGRDADASGDEASFFTPGTVALVRTARGTVPLLVPLSMVPAAVLGSLEGAVRRAVARGALTAS
jgi:CheY-like chemotaxis protein